MIKNILNVGLPSGIESSMFMVGKLLTQRIFAVFGTAAMAANAIASVINSFSFMPGTAFGLALLTVVGQCIGAGDYAAAKKQTSKIMKIASITLFIISAATFIFMQPLVSLFNLSEEAHKLAKSILRVHCFSMALGWAMSFCLPSALRAAGDARYVLVVTTISMWLVRVCSAYLFAFPLGLGPLGVWLAMGVDFFVRGISYYLRWIKGKWQEKRVITN
jgi:Na+-driven multidrug efflux pump